MGKFLTLLKASMSEGMNLFTFRKRGSKKAARAALLAFLAIALSFYVYTYADMMLEPLEGTGMEYSVLTMFGLFSAIFILAEGLYKSSGLLFNCKDDDLVLSLPVKKSSVFLLRMTKFYLFELIFSVLVIVPTMVAYALRTGGNVEPTFYLVGAVSVLLLPVIPVVLAVLLAMAVSGVASRFRFKNLVQIILTIALLIGVLALSLNLQNIMAAIAEHASSISEVITRLYYPVGAFIQMVTDFNVTTLLIFIAVNVCVAVVFTYAFSRIYFKVNSRSKIVKISKHHKKGRVRTRGVMKALMTKEVGKFTSSPVFLINAGFSLVLYVVAIALIVINLDGTLGMLAQMGIGMSTDDVLNLMPVILAGLIIFSALMTSITCSMISLEGRTINLLKSMPVSAFKIVMAKVLVAVLIVVPVFIIGDIVMFVKFNFDIWQILIILALSIVMPVVAEVMGIIINLKNPKMDAENDTEVVKQSTSSLIAVFSGMVLSGMTIYVIFNCVSGGTPVTDIMLALLVTYTLSMTGLIVYLKVRGEKLFNEIDA